MRLIVLFVLLLSTNLVLACSCGPLRDFQTNKDLKEYSFIALVTIKKLPPVDSSNRFMRLRRSSDIGIASMELFKGDTVSTVYDPSFKSDCALSIKEGEQWMLFGYALNGRIEVSKCGYSVIYRDTLGRRDWKYFNGIKQLDLLRSIYGHSIRGSVAEKEFYTNGQLELVRRFRKNKLNGWSTIYYPNGKINIKEKFKNGVRVKDKRIYHLNGQLMEVTEYNKGMITRVTQYQDTTELSWYLNFKATHLKDFLFGDKEHTARYYYSLLDSLRELKAWDKQIKYQRLYTDNGRSYAFKMYNYKGDMEVDDYLDWNKQLSEHTLYYDNGKPHMYIRLDRRNNQEVEYDYQRMEREEISLKHVSRVSIILIKAFLLVRPKRFMCNSLYLFRLHFINTKAARWQLDFFTKHHL